MQTSSHILPVLECSDIDSILTMTSYHYSASDRCYIDEYEPVLFLGPEIIPLVVYELTKPENFFATSLCIPHSRSTLFAGH